jgi:uncharacterized membrane protein
MEQHSSVEQILKKMAEGLGEEPRPASSSWSFPMSRPSISTSSRSPTAEEARDGLKSSYAKFGDILVALIGHLGFALLFGMALWRVIGQDRTPSWPPLALMLTAWFGLAFELVMTWVEFFVIETVCPYCLTALACITASCVAAVLAWRGSRTLSSVEVRHA